MKPENTRIIADVLETAILAAFFIALIVLGQNCAWCG